MHVMTNDMSECFTEISQVWDFFFFFLLFFCEFCMRNGRSLCSDGVWLGYLDTTDDFQMCVAEN